MKDNIKDITRKISRLSSSDLSELESALMENGISATMYRFSPIESMWDDNPEEKKCYLVLLHCGNRKLMVVKTLKEVFGWGLKEAKTIADEAPTLITKLMSVSKAEAIEEKLEAIGARTELRYPEK